TGMVEASTLLGENRQPTSIPLHEDTCAKVSTATSLAVFRSPLRFLLFKTHPTFPSTITAGFSIDTTSHPSGFTLCSSAAGSLRGETSTPRSWLTANRETPLPPRVSTHLLGRGNEPSSVME